MHWKLNICILDRVMHFTDQLSRDSNLQPLSDFTAIIQVDLG